MMSMPAEQIEEQIATEQVIEMDGPCFSEDGFEADVKAGEEAERLNRTLDQ
jgi:hypothetical protein